MQKAAGLALILMLVGCGSPVVVEPGPDAGVAGKDAAVSSCPSDFSPCGEDCCEPGYSCDPDLGTCEPDSCRRQCQGRSCGPDQCGSLCGLCSPGTACDLERGNCFLCTGTCLGKQCGDDGCGRSCGTCSGSYCTSDYRCAGGTPPDASVAGPDASSPVDAGPGRDAGTPGRDASLPGPDAGQPGRDAGQPGPDAGTGVARVLFDNTKAEQAGNADWVIDDSGRYPQPANPTVESDWYGGCSSWGFALQRSGRFALETLPPSGSITYGNPNNPQDLSRYQVFVVNEPNVLFTEAETLALVQFVYAGGGLFMIADHGGADRNNDGFDAVMVWNQLALSRGNPFGITFTGDSVWEAPSSNLRVDPANPVLHGAWGHVAAMGMYAGSTLSLSPAVNPSVQALGWKRGASGTSQVILATAQFGSGRVVALGDSSPTDDGTGPGVLHDGWNDPVADNDVLILNATSWLAKQR